MPISKGWWNKYLLFKPQLLTGYVLYLDLDMIVVGDLVKYFVRDNQLTLLEKAYDSDAYLRWSSTTDIGDQQVILDSLLKFSFFHHQELDILNL